MKMKKIIDWPVYQSTETLPLLSLLSFCCLIRMFWLDGQFSFLLLSWVIFFVGLIFLFSHKNVDFVISFICFTNFSMFFSVSRRFKTRYFLSKSRHRTSKDLKTDTKDFSNVISDTSIFWRVQACISLFCLDNLFNWWQIVISTKD